MIEIVCWTCKKTSFFSGREEKAICQNQECQKLIIDNGIWSLTAVINLMGIKTDGSCEGHNDFDSGCYSYPWVSMPKDVPMEKIGRLFILVNKHNCEAKKKDLAQWRLEFNQKEDCWWLYPEDGQEKDCQVLHQESKILAGYIRSRK